MREKGNIEAADPSIEGPARRHIRGHHRQSGEEIVLTELGGQGQPLQMLEEGGSQTGPGTTIGGDGTRRLKPQGPLHPIEVAGRLIEESHILPRGRMETGEVDMIGTIDMTVAETMATDEEMIDGREENPYTTIGGRKENHRRIEMQSGRGSWLPCSKMPRA